MMRHFFLLLVVVSAVEFVGSVHIYIPETDGTDADASKDRKVCLDRRFTRNSKDVYPNPEDCHTYYRCYFASDSHAIAVKHHCPPGHFYSTDLSQCIPEGQVPCSDKCRNGSVVEVGCYTVKWNCAMFYKCSNAISEEQCCDAGMRANLNTCECEVDPNVPPCADKCKQRQKLITVDEKLLYHSALEDATHNLTHCKDQFGNTLMDVGGRPNMFSVVRLANSLVSPQALQRSRKYIKAKCPINSLFDLRSCRCRKMREAEDSPDDHIGHFSDMGKQCSVYLPFDEDAENYAEEEHHYYDSYLYGDTDITQEVSAHGTGSLFLTGGRVEIPNISRMDLRDSASFCLFFRCGSSENNFECSGKSSVISNRVSRNSLEFSITLYTMPVNQIVVNMGFENPSYVAAVNGSVNFRATPGFNQVCSIYDGSYVSLYINNVLMNKAPAAGFVRSGLGIFTLGYDNIAGHFQGHVDEVLVCRHAMTQLDVNAHFKGASAMRQAGLIP